MGEVHHLHRVCTGNIEFISLSRPRRVIKALQIPVLSEVHIKLRLDFQRREQSQGSEDTYKKKPVHQYKEL
jgi:hypothetical protein